jgi:hypothetical protein
MIFDALAPGFSYFSITGDETVPVNETISCDNDGICDPGETIQNCPGDCLPAGQVCDTGQTTCSESSLYICNNDGTDWIFVRECELGCYGSTCAESTIIGNGDMLYVLLIIIVSVAIVLAVVIMGRLRRRPSRHKATGSTGKGHGLLKGRIFRHKERKPASEGKGIDAKPGKGKSGDGDSEKGHHTISPTGARSETAESPDLGKPLHEGLTAGSPLAEKGEDASAREEVEMRIKYPGFKSMPRKIRLFFKKPFIRRMR